MFKLCVELSPGSRLHDVLPGAELLLNEKSYWIVLKKTDKDVVGRVKRVSITMAYKMGPLVKKWLEDLGPEFLFPTGTDLLGHRVPHRGDNKYILQGIGATKILEHPHIAP